MEKMVVILSPAMGNGLELARKLIWGRHLFYPTTIAYEHFEGQTPALRRVYNLGWDGSWLYIRLGFEDLPDVFCEADGTQYLLGATWDFVEGRVPGQMIYRRGLALARVTWADDHTCRAEVLAPTRREVDELYGLLRSNKLSGLKTESWRRTFPYSQYLR